MTKEERIAVFSHELQAIKDKDLRAFAEYCLSKVPEYFFHIPASSTGKYHPPQDLGEGGLVRHTKGVVQWHIELQRWWEEDPIDEAIVALLLHDSHKDGLGDNGQSRHTVKNHADIAAEEVLKWGKEFGVNENSLQLIYEGIKGHMGIWSSCMASRPQSQFAKKCSLADYCASRKIGFEPFN